MPPPNKSPNSGVDCSLHGLRSTVQLGCCYVTPSPSPHLSGDSVLTGESDACRFMPTIGSAKSWQACTAGAVVLEPLKRSPAAATVADVPATAADDPKTSVRASLAACTRTSGYVQGLLGWWGQEVDTGVERWGWVMVIERFCPLRKSGVSRSMCTHTLQCGGISRHKLTGSAAPSGKSGAGSRQRGGFDSFWK